MIKCTFLLSTFCSLDSKWSFPIPTIIHIFDLHRLKENYDTVQQLLLTCILHFALTFFKNKSLLFVSICFFFKEKSQNVCSLQIPD